MSRLTEYFQSLEARGRTALAPYFMAGFPSLDASFELMKEAVAAGADFIEMGMPFSDPLADGPTIQKAGVAALEHPFTLAELIERFGREKEHFPIPVACMSYYNPIYQLGLDESARRAAEAGIAGFIVPDLPLEECAPFVESCKKAGIDFIPLIAPTTGPDRIRRIDEAATGILYYVSRLGITGARSELPAEIVERLEELKRVASHPALVGFGISRPDQAAKLKGHVGGVIVGSALVEVIEKSSNGEARKAVRDFLQPLSEVLG